MELDNRLRVVLGGLAVALLAVIAMATSALGANQSEGRLTSARNVALAQRSDDYFNCLSAQAHSLIGPGNVVYLPSPTLSQAITVVKVIGGWARMTLQESQSNLALTLQRSDQPGTCDGDVLVTITRRPDGHLLIRRGLQR